jgi:hypothetical protein
MGIIIQMMVDFFTISTEILSECTELRENQLNRFGIGEYLSEMKTISG